MSKSLRCLLTGLIDYAGLFPPAQLPMEEAVRNYVSYARCTDAWMLGRFVCPLTRMDEFRKTLSKVDFDRPLRLALLGRGGDGFVKFQNNLREDLHAIATWNSDGLHPFRAEMIEVKLPTSGSYSDSESMLAAVAGNILDRTIPVFYELPAIGNWVTISRTFRRREDEPQLAGIKIRCGGLSGPDFPAANRVAEVMASCREFSIPLKATAGLHHPLRHREVGLDVMAHGYINLFAAGALCHARRLDVAIVQQILEDEDAGSFRFDAERMHWRDLSATTAEIALARKEAVSSFGSCSFDEPREDLRALGWLPT